MTTTLSRPAPTVSRPRFALESYGLSDRGRVRTSNEDCCAATELKGLLRVRHTNHPQGPAKSRGQRAYAFLVADGVGGNEAGEIASELAVRTVEEHLINNLHWTQALRPAEEQVVQRDLQAALVRADARIFEEMARHPGRRRMATTLTLAFAIDGHLFVAHVGDSRCYLYSGGRLQQLTRDHTVTAEMVRLGLLSPESTAGHPFRHVVTNILGGAEAGVKVELHSLNLQGGDVILLCSDGLTEMVPDERIAGILREQCGPRESCERLVAEANAAGGRDNITVIVAHVEGAP
jgi:serine/threonine protein phosphatase PrpC